MKTYTDYLLETLTTSIYAASDSAGDVRDALRRIGGPPRVGGPDRSVDTTRTTEIVAIIENLEAKLADLKALLNTEVR